MGYAIVVSTSAASPTSGAVTTSNINTTGCDLIVAIGVGFTGVTSPIPGVSDSASNTWIPCNVILSGLSSVQVQGFYAKNAITSSAHNFSYGGTQTFVALAIVGASGSDLTAPLVTQNGSNNGGGSTTCQGGPVNPGINGCLYISAGVLVDTGFTAISINDGFTLDQVIATNGGFNQGIFESYFIQSTSAILNPTTTFNSSGRAAITNLVFQPASTPPPSSNQSGLALLGVG